MAADHKYLLVGRINGKSASRRQRAFTGGPMTARAIERWEAEGFNTFWVYGPVTLVGHDWSRPLLGSLNRHQDTSGLKDMLRSRG